jgi:hypothetical protein
MAAVSHPAPKRFDCCLNAPEHGSRRCGHVLYEKQSATRFKHAENFAGRSSLIHHAAKNQSADGEIDAGTFDRQFFRGTRAQIDVNSKPAGFVLEMPAHVRVRFDANPSNGFRRQVAEIGSGTRTDLQDRARQAGKQPRLVWREVVVSFVPA